MPNGEITLWGAVPIAQRRLEVELAENPDQPIQDTLTKCLIDVWHAAYGLSSLPDKNCPPLTKESAILLDKKDRLTILASLK